MKQTLFAAALAVSCTILGFAAQPALAQSIQVGNGLNGGFDIFTDRSGRRFLVDPETGDVVGRANPNARFTHRDRQQAQRAFRRTLRNARLNGELDSLFGLFDRRDRGARRTQEEFDQADQGDPFLAERRILRRQRQERLFDNQPDIGDEDQDSIDRQPLGLPSETIEQNEEIARLPGADQVQRSVTISGVTKPKYSKTQMAALQVYLDRSGFSPGAIDGQWGSNVEKAVVAWREGTSRSDDLGQADVLDRLMAETGGDAFTTYTITAADVQGPYVDRVPVDYGEKAKLETLGYTSVVEMLAEKFHMSQGYLRALNAGKSFTRVGTTIKVAKPGNMVKDKVHYIVADKGRKQIRAFNRSGKLIVAYPATIGSAATPSPVGTHSVERIAVNPEYTYNPKKNFKQGNNDKILRIPPGPNGPVGSVWIALSKPTYGIHGTPNPETIGKTNSHGCIRLTNWDATELAKMVRKGVTVEFVE